MIRNPESGPVGENRRGNRGVRMYGSPDNEVGLSFNTSHGSAIVLDGRGINSDKSELLALLALGAIHRITSTDPREVSDVVREALGQARSSTESRGDTVSVAALHIVESESERAAVVGVMGKARAYMLYGERRDLLTFEDGVELSGSHSEPQQHSPVTLLRRPLIVPVHNWDRLLLAGPGVQILTEDEIRGILMSDVADPAEAIVNGARKAMSGDRRVQRDLSSIKAIVVDIDPRKIEHELQGGEPLTVQYTGFPIVVGLPDGAGLEIGFSEDLGGPPGDDERLVVLNRELNRRSLVGEGIDWLDEIDTVNVVQLPNDLGWDTYHGKRMKSVFTIGRSGNEVTFSGYEGTEPIPVITYF